MQVEGEGKYKVKLVSLHCRPEDTIKEIAASLDHLNNITNEIFSSIRTRLSEQRVQVKLMTTRVAAAAEQVAQIKSSQKAIKIVSSAKFPCENENGDNSLLDINYPALISKAVPPQTIHCSSNDNEEDGQRRILRYDPPLKNPDDLLACLHVTENELRNLSRLNDLYEAGLGKPPSKLDKMDSFYLFNTAENPYQHYKVSERSRQERNGGVLKVRKGEEVHADVSPQANPDSDIVVDTTEVNDFYYYPSSLQIPDIDVPDHLPNLPGIADNFSLPGMDTMPPLFAFQRPSSLSMSTSTSSNFSSLFTTPTSPPQRISSTAPSVTTSSTSPSPAKPVSASQVSHPATPDVRQVPIIPKDVVSNVPVVGSSSGSAPPPPPPPPPPPAAAVEQPSTSTSVPKKVPMGSGEPDMRSNLMAAIREAGGSGSGMLKSAKDKKYEARRKKQEDKEKSIAAESGGDADLISDLKNALAMRRRGISGLNKERQAGLGDIMQKLVTTIPTIEDSNESILGGGGSDEEDWD